MRLFKYIFQHKALSSLKNNTMTESEYDYSRINEFEKGQLPTGFLGDVYNISYKWLSIIPEPIEPVKILEIGIYHGANVCSYMKTYAKHPKSEVHCIDPYIDYQEYPEYKEKQTTNYSIFMNNISKLAPVDLNKIYFYRDLSSTILSQLKDDSFDIIFIDGNHETRYVLEDAVLCHRKIKQCGWIIFDDVHDPQVISGVNAFLGINSDLFEGFFVQHSQLFIKRK
jgi:hypothetical protein